MTSLAPPSARQLLLGAAALWLAPAASVAQRREGSTSDARLELALPAAVRFGEQVLPARLYRLSLAEGKLSFTDANTMVTAATVAVVESAGSDWVSPAKVELKKKGAAIEVIVRSGDRIYVASGAPADGGGAGAQSYEVQLAKNATALDLGAAPEQQSDRQLVARALERYGADVKRCAEKAQKSAWTTDDPRFVKCVCPLAKKWRMPKLSAELLMHHELAKGRAGMSFTVSADGKVKSCRVWVGASPPAEESAAPAAPAQAAPETAPPAAEAAQP